MRPHHPLQSLSAAWLRKLCSQVKLLSTPKKPICFTWTGCKRSFVAVFSLWEKSQVEKALLKIWQRGKVDVNRIWKQELFQREAYLERKNNFSSTLVLEGLKSVLWIQSQGRVKYLCKRGLGDPWDWQIHGHFSPPNKLDFRADLYVVSLKNAYRYLCSRFSRLWTLPQCHQWKGQLRGFLIMDSMKK